MELDQLESSVAFRRLHERELRADALEPNDAIHPAALDRPLALQLESELDKERSHGREIVNHDADVVHPLNRHVLDGKRRRSRKAPSNPRVPRGSTPNSRASSMTLLHEAPMRRRAPGAGSRPAPSYVREGSQDSPAGSNAGSPNASRRLEQAVRARKSLRVNGTLLPGVVHIPTGRRDAERASVCLTRICVASRGKDVRQTPVHLPRVVRPP